MHNRKLKISQNEFQGKKFQLNFLPFFGGDGAPFLFSLPFGIKFWHSTQYTWDGYKLTKSEVIIGITNQLKFHH